MSTKASQARDNAGLFLDHQTEHALPKKRSQRLRRAGLVDGIVDGERVLIAAPAKEPLEREIEIRIRVAICAAGVLCWKHTVETCVCCGQRPTQRTGLGIGCADLICIVPPFGRFLAIEVKRPSTRNAKRDEHQRKWMGIVRRHGGVAGVATNELEALELLASARRPNDARRSPSGAATESNSVAAPPISTVQGEKGQ